MIYTFDPPKRTANLRRHKLDFSLIDDDFFANAIVLKAKHGRFQAIGTLSGSYVVVSAIFIPLGQEAISIISLRPASKKERKLLNDKKI